MTIAVDGDEGAEKCCWSSFDYLWATAVRSLAGAVGVLSTDLIIMLVKCMLLVCGR